MCRQSGAGCFDHHALGRRAPGLGGLVGLANRLPSARVEVQVLERRRCDARQVLSRMTAVAAVAATRLGGDCDAEPPRPVVAAVDAVVLLSGRRDPWRSSAMVIVGGLAFPDVHCHPVF